MYDEAGHLLGEYSSTGAIIQETVWVDNTPVATLRPNGSAITIYYVHTDHLNAPRIVTQPSSNEPTWLWGGNAANQNPVGLGTFIYNLRYPGQYFQAETGLNYNNFRDYDPATGRYIESDPIGLAGGQLSTYAYANDNPVMHVDPSGLFSLSFSVTEIPTLFVPSFYDGNTTSSVTHMKCTCSPTCENNWQLKGCSGTLQINVYLQRLLFPLNYLIARAQEQQHVNDYGAAQSAMEADLTQKENSLKNNQYQDEKSCADAAQAALIPIIKAWQERIAVASHNNYDLPGGPQ